MEYISSVITWNMLKQVKYLPDLKTEMARIYRQYGIVPPGGQGLNVCMDRDVFLSIDQGGWNSQLTAIARW